MELPQVQQDEDEDKSSLVDMLIVIHMYAGWVNILGQALLPEDASEKAPMIEGIVDKSVLDFQQSGASLATISDWVEQSEMADAYRWTEGQLTPFVRTVTQSRADPAAEAEADDAAEGKLDPPPAE